MKKKIFVICAVSSATLLSLGVLAVLPKAIAPAYGNDDPYHMILDSSSQVEEVEREGGILYQANYKENKIDFVGYSDEGGTLGSIKKETFGTYTYNGMIYNRSVINGFKSLTVDFSGGGLSYVFSDFLMEDMDFEGEPLTSGTAVEVPHGEAYFIIYNESTTPVNINSIDLEYSCDGSIDGEMIFNKTSTMGGARSLAKKTTLEDSFVELENNPTKYTNNYSVGAHYRCSNC